VLSVGAELKKLVQDGHIFVSLLGKRSLKFFVFLLKKPKCMTSLGEFSGADTVYKLAQIFWKGKQ